MSQQITTQKASPLVVMASKFNADPTKLYNTLKATVFKEARTDEELQALVIVANQYGLNPLTKEIYAFPAKGGGIVPVVSVDGWLRMMNDHPQFDGISYEWEHADKNQLVSCTAIIHRKDRANPTRVTEYYDECKRVTEPWKMAHRMLRHKATIQCARVAFGFSGIIDEDEAGVRDVTPPSAATSKLFAKAEPAPQVQQVAQVMNAAQVTIDRVNESGIDWHVIARVCLDNGIFDEARDNVNDCTDDELAQIESQWLNIVKLVKEVQP